MNEARSALTCHEVNDLDFILSILNSNIPRDDMSFLRDLNVERPYYHPNETDLPLPEGVTPIDPPAFGPLPQNWLQEFMAPLNNIPNENIGEEEEENSDVNSDEENDDSGFESAEDDIESVD
jgi:hypothetical protein